MEIISSSDVCTTGGGNNRCGGILVSDIGRTQVWNRERVRPDVCDMFERIAVPGDPNTRVWRGSGDMD